MKRRIAIGDIHGCYKSLVKLIESQIRPGKSDQLYFVGDYIDRGPASRDVLDYIIELANKGYKVFPLKGNHEDLLEKAIDDNKYLLAWFQNGAEPTLKSFGIHEDEIYGPEVLRHIPEKYIRFISALPYYYDLDDYIIVHAGLNLSGPGRFEDIHSMLWSREIKGLNLLDDKTAIVHGHTPMPIQTIRSNLKNTESKNLNIDAGCVYTGLPGYGRLVGLDLDSRIIYVQENIDSVS